MTACNGDPDLSASWRREVSPSVRAATRW